MEVLAFNPPGLETDETAEDANSVIDVNDVVAGRQRRRQRTGFGMAAAMRAAGLLAKPEDLQIGEEKELRFRSGPAAVEIRCPNLECPGCNGSGAAEASRRRSRRGKMSCSSNNSVRRSTWSVAMAMRQPSTRRCRTSCSTSPRRPANLGASASVTVWLGNEFAVSRSAKRQYATSAQRLANARPGRDRAAKSRRQLSVGNEGIAQLACLPLQLGRDQLNSGWFIDDDQAIRSEIVCERGRPIDEVCREEVQGGRRLSRLQHLNGPGPLGADLGTQPIQTQPAQLVGGFPQAFHGKFSRGQEANLTQPVV